MSFTINEQRQKTMLKRIGEASELIDDLRFLPFYRGVQIRLEKLGKAEEWLKMIATAKTKANPSKYFASICKMVRDGTYKFVEKVKEVTGEIALYLNDKLVKFNFGKYHKFYIKKASEFINKNGQAGFVELLELAERKNISQKYMAKAILNCKSPSNYFKLSKGLN